MFGKNGKLIVGACLEDQTEQFNKKRSWDDNGGKRLANQSDHKCWEDTARKMVAIMQEETEWIPMQVTIDSVQQTM